MPPSAGATPVPDQPRVFGLANGDTRIVIHAVHDTWLQVRDRDHLPIFTQTLHAGDIYHVPDRPGLVMRVAHGAAIAITVDGRPTRPIGSALQPNVAMDPARLLAGTAVLEQTPSRAGAAH